MAITSSIICSRCGQKRDVTHSIRDYPSVCDECIKIEEETAKSEFLAKRAVLPIEERLALIESWIYDKDNEPEKDYWDRLIG